MKRTSKVKSHQLNNKTAIVTGGSRGIGLTIAKALAKNKYNVVICSRNISQARKAKKQIESFGVKCLAYKVDVSSYPQCKLLVTNTVNNFSRIDLLVNNAGLQGSVKKLWLNSVKEWEKTIKVNLLGTFYMMHLVIPCMLKQKSGTIINLSGGGGAYGRPNFSAYGCSKAAVLRLTETVVSELGGKNIKVIAIGPGVVWTKMAKDTLEGKHNELSRNTLLELRAARKTGGTPPDKIERLISYLIGKDSRKFSGKLLHVNELDKIIKNSTRIGPESGLLRRVSYN